MYRFNIYTIAISNNSGIAIILCGIDKIVGPWFNALVQESDQ